MSSRKQPKRRVQTSAQAQDDTVHGKKSTADNAVGDQNTPPPRVRVPRLTSIAAVRKEICRQYGAHLRGDIGNKTLSARVHALKAVRDSFIADDLEQRIRSLEKRTDA